MGKIVENREDINQVVFISDVHFGIRNGTIEWLENQRSYFKEFFIPLLKQQKKQKQKPCVVVAGDYFDNRQNVDIAVLNTAIDIMAEMASVCPVYVMIGNHDIYKKSDTDITSLRPMIDMKNVTLIYDRMELEIKGGKRFLLVSWVGDMKKENKIITDNKDKFDYLVFHTELAGMTYANNRPIINGLQIDLCDDNCRILSGHIHKRQETKKGLYFGSPYQMERSDIGDQKGIYIFTVEGENMTRTFVENNYSPKFLCVRFGDIGRNPEKWKDIVANNYVDIVFTEDETAKVNVNNFLDDIQVYGPKHIELQVEKRKVDLQEGVVFFDDAGNFVDMTVEPDATIEEIFDKRVDQMNLKNDEIKDIKKMNEEYLKKAAEEL
jgi:DNA repair exonuclease SbcCD nuclease subunit